MTEGKTYEVTLVNKDKPVRFTVARRLGFVESQKVDTVGCGDPNCKGHQFEVAAGENGENRKVEVALTSKGTLVFRRLNYSQNRAESHQVFESVQHLIANLNQNLPEEVALTAQLQAFESTGVTVEEQADKDAEAAKAAQQAAYEAKAAAEAEEAAKNAPEEI